MSSDKQVKSCLVITYGPVPTPQYQTVEGGGMRAWGLADGLKSHGVDVTIGINNSFPQEMTEHEGVRLINWGLDADFVQRINSYDAVIISYCMGDPSVFVADNINDDVMLILDAYVPIYIEVSARDSKDIDAEYVNYMADLQRHNHTLKRGDYFLYANDAQELLYSGVLSALGIINPYSYRHKRLLKTPFGIHRLPAVAKTNPYEDLGIKDNDFIVLWFGGIYPWFHVEEYLAAIKELSVDSAIKFVFVGGKNPFNPNPDFSRQYDTAVSFAEQKKLAGKSVFFVDWVDFQDRVDYYKHADVVVSLNQPGEENKFSWRTRVMDYVWGGVATISNGSDPLSEDLLAHGAAIRLPELSAKALTKAIRNVKTKPTELDAVRKQVVEAQKRYFWDVITAEVAGVIDTGDLPYRNEQPLRKLVGQTVETSAAPARSASKMSLVASLPIKVARKVRQKGVLRTVKIAGGIVKTQIKNRRPVKRPPQFIFISNPINNTGAPIVLLQIVEEYVKKYGAKRVRVIAPGVDEPKQKEYLRKLGVNVEHAVFGVGFHFIRLQLGLQKDDVVFMNTAAIYDSYRDFILLWLKNGRLGRAYWFIHEDIAQLPIIHKEFLNKRNLAQIAQLSKAGSLKLLFPSKRTAEEYDELFGAQMAFPINLRVEVDKHYIRPKTAKDFTAIDFLLSGTAGDGRKGQVLALSAFHSFIKDYYEKDPSKYRPFKLHLVAVDRTTYIAQQVRWIGETQLADHVIIYDSLPKAEALDITSKCNAVICCSLNETFGLYVAEGMLMGHIVLRNNTAGVDEQLQEGVNGYMIDHTNILKFAKTLEKILNVSTVSNEDLLQMSNKSVEIINVYSQQNYLTQIEKL